ncbi:nodulation efficiency protein NfeD [Leptospira ryugenii]|uniref:Nodulation efficiency protein NfeD n=1 Tax=Leptospira ryugenii TaxID=1917863 RepID=A0A2P2DWP6_9LEPT|nr:NfeD family protein [Leptospira ryugenii]GBF49000.1 nodulation efficiency protein NfeD [Leptospira ryugenii]
MDLITESSTLWIISAVIFIALEFVFPGTFIMFLGFGSLVTGLVHLWFPLSFSQQAIVWMVSTLGSLLIGGHFVRKLFRSEKTVDPFVKEDYLNQIVKVEQDILVGQLGGKVRFQGTIWDATTQGKRIPKGSLVRITRRDNLTFFVEPTEPVA